MQIKYQTLICAIPSGTPAGINAFTVTLEQDYNHAKGVAVYEVKQSDLSNNTLGIRQSDGKVYQDRTTVKDYLTSDSVPQDRRYKEFGENIVAQGKVITVEIETFSDTGDDTEYHVIFQLIKE